MNLIHGFVSAGQFYDDVHFPYGFSRSGKFSLPESELLSTVGKRLWHLEQGIASAENQVEENFVRMCKEGSPAETKVERLWLKYKESIKVKSFHTLNGNTKTSSNDNDGLGENY